MWYVIAYVIAHSSERDVGSDRIEYDDVFDALADPQRRRLLIDLLDSDPQYVGDLCDASRELIDAREAFLDQFLSGQFEISGVDRALIQQHHVHLPKLAEYEFIEWHPEEYRVTKGPRFDELTPFLELVKTQQTARPVTEPFVSFRE